MNPGQVGLGSSRPESTQPGQLGRVKSAIYIRFSYWLIEKGVPNENTSLQYIISILKLDFSSLLLLYLTNHQDNTPM